MVRSADTEQGITKEGDTEQATPSLLGLTLSADACVSLVRGYDYELGSQEFWEHNTHCCFLTVGP